VVTSIAFALFVMALAAQRVLELRRSRLNERELVARGGREHAQKQVRVMQALHASWFLAMGYEVFALEAELVPGLALAAFALFIIGQALRYAAMHALGPRWTVRIITVPTAPVVRRGIYRHLRHPNYLGVILEILAVPLLHGAWRTALVFSCANAAFLVWRIRAEERALRAESDYAERFADCPRLLPAAMPPSFGDSANQR
jgi:methyltransferase